MLSNTLPNSATDAIKSDITEIANGNGYSTGGVQVSITMENIAGNIKITIPDVIITASGGTMAEFQYAIFYNDTPTNPLDPLIAWWDHGVPINLLDTQSVTLDSDQVNGLFVSG
jgi:hypothetical protein